MKTGGLKVRPPNKHVGASVRWLLRSWAALFIMSLLIPLIARTGLAGVMVYLALFLLTAILCLLLWLVIRFWPRGRFRAFNFLRAFLILVLALVSGCLYVSGARAIVRFFGDRGELPIPDRFVAVIVCDGARLIQAEALLMEGLEDESLYATTISRNFPTISRYFIQNGAFTANGLSVWPSSSVPAHTGIMTGSYP